MQAPKMTTVSVGKLLVALGHAIIDGNHLKRPAKCRAPPADQVPLPIMSQPDEPERYGMADTPASTQMRAEAEAPKGDSDLAAPAKRKAREAASSIVPTSNTESEAQLAAPAKPKAEAVIVPSSSEAHLERPTRKARAAIVPPGEAQVSTGPSHESPSRQVVDWNEILVPCPSAEATDALAVLEAACAKYGLAVTRQNFKRSMQTVVRRPDGTARRVFNHSDRGVAWKLK